MDNDTALFEKILRQLSKLQEHTEPVQSDFADMVRAERVLHVSIEVAHTPPDDHPRGHWQGVVEDCKQLIPIYISLLDNDFPSGDGAGFRFSLPEKLQLEDGFPSTLGEWA